MENDHLSSNEKLSLHLPGRVIIFNAQDISHIEFHKGVTKFFIDNEQTCISSKPIKEFAFIIEKCGLFQVNQSFYINFDKIHEYRKADKIILMTNNAIVILGKTFKPEFLKRLDKFHKF